MANIPFNIARGMIRYYCGLPAASDSLILVLLKQSGLQVDSTLADHDTLSVLLAASNDECDFTNYARKTITPTITVNDSSDLADITFSQQTWSSAGGTTDNNIGAALLCYVPSSGAADSAIIPLTKHDFVRATVGTDLLLDVQSPGFWGSR